METLPKDADSGKYGLQAVHKHLKPDSTQLCNLTVATPLHAM